MNKDICTGFKPYRQHVKPNINSDYVKKGFPLSSDRSLHGMVIHSLRKLAAIFLLFLSTLSGNKTREAGHRAVKMAKTCLMYAALVLALWLALILLSNIVNAVSLLPMWSLIPIFALTMLAICRYLI